MKRREFLKLSASTVGALGATGVGAQSSEAAAEDSPGAADHRKSRPFNGPYSGERLRRVAFPMGGMGAGMVCLEGTGALSHFSLRNRPQIFNEPVTFAAISIKGSPHMARVLEGPVPDWKKFGNPGAGQGASGTAFGLPHFREASFLARFPFGIVTLEDKDLPLAVEITGWSPFEPGDADNSSLPVAGLEYRFINHSRRSLEAVFSWSARNFMIVGQNSNGVKPAPGGFVLWGGAPKDRGWEEGAFAVTVSEPSVRVNHTWFRGGWWDPLTMAWKQIDAADAPEKLDELGSLQNSEWANGLRAILNWSDESIMKDEGRPGGPSPGATLFVPFTLAPGASKTIVLRLAWHVGQTDLRIGKDPKPASGEQVLLGHYKPWYAERFKGIAEVNDYWRDHYDELRRKTKRFSDCFYDSTLPPEVIEAVAANLTILKSPTVLRQADGRLWGWEGCGDDYGCCHGTCTHVWNYAQSIPHLFPALERGLREMEFGPSQDERGHQQFRSSLPIRPVVHDFHAAADGQLGGIMKVFRDWRISGDTDWLRRLWPKVQASLNYCIRTWDPLRKGWVEEPHHNTYDIEFWGPEPMCTSFYLGALKAATLMGSALGEDIAEYAGLLEKGSQRMQNDLFNGEYFIQKNQWQGLQARSTIEAQAGGAPEAMAVLEKEGPKYQYGAGCLTDGVLGAWLAMVCGVGQVADAHQVTNHLRAVHKHNLKADLTAHANPQRPGYACGAEGGLLLCTWPKGGQPSLPFVYSNEVWTGIEYQAASHLMLMGFPHEGLEIVRTARARYDGLVRNPFNEYECGHWYARAMSSYALLQGLSGARYDAVDKVLYLKPAMKGDFRCFLSTATGYGTVGIKHGEPFLDVVSGGIEVKEIKHDA